CVKGTFGRQLALENDFRIVFERVGHDAGVGRVDDAVFVADLEDVLERVGLTAHVEGKSMQLEALAFPLLRARQDFIDMLVVLGAILERRPKKAEERSDEHERSHANLDISMCHKDFRGCKTSLRISP